MSDWIDVVPAYGVDYTSQAQVQKAWNAGKDFRVVSFGPFSGKYLNKPDAKRFLTGDHIMVRFNKQQKVYEVK